VFFYIEEQWIVPELKEVGTFEDRDDDGERVAHINYKKLVDFVGKNYLVVSNPIPPRK